jgi:hypothetical protein
MRFSVKPYKKNIIFWLNKIRWEQLLLIEINSKRRKCNAQMTLCMYFYEPVRVEHRYIYAFWWFVIQSRMYWECDKLHHEENVFFYLLFSVWFYFLLRNFEQYKIKENVNYMSVIINVIFVICHIGFVTLHHLLDLN